MKTMIWQIQRTWTLSVLVSALVIQNQSGWPRLCCGNSNNKQYLSDLEHLKFISHFHSMSITGHLRGSALSPLLKDLHLCAPMIAKCKKKETWQTVPQHIHSHFIGYNKSNDHFSHQSSLTFHWLQVTWPLLMLKRQGSAFYQASGNRIRNTCWSALMTTLNNPQSWYIIKRSGTFWDWRWRASFVTWLECLFSHFTSSVMLPSSLSEPSRNVGISQQVLQPDPQGRLLHTQANRKYLLEELI